LLVKTSYFSLMEAGWREHQRRNLI